ncbi:RNA binding protein [Leucosporidium creatinivorum]|uniref:60S ribosomal export protein NMD3 n=1 Tax=Leucosporidium creatinivorum TaxID=106004 RepID=A0A1Y2G432_9BASI|nr:RNA binding protein [Leucosporidium creatinivorum]
MSGAITYVGPSQQTAYVLCADCGTPIEPNGANLCVNCLRNSIDITEGIPKQAAVNFCKGCSRYLAPPTQWVICEMESRELLAICLRKLKGLAKVRLIDAGFIWTEPHSKRLRVKLTIQKEVFSSTILQQIFEVEYIIQGSQCPECTRLAAKNTWRALVQVRQKVDHKRTFLYLEQLILKHNADKDTISVTEVKDGLNFFYATKQHALKMVDFLGAIAPTRSKASEQLISQDIHSSTTNAKLTYSVEIIPICKDDIVCLPIKIARSMSNIAQLTVCHRVGNQIYLIDPVTLTLGDISANVYWRAPFPTLVDITQATEYIVLDIEPTSHPPKTAKGGRFLLADAQVSPVGGSMNSDVIYHTRTHLGAVLKPGDTVLGYMLGSANFNNEAWENLNMSRVPEVILVRKTYPNRRKKSKARAWKLKSMVPSLEGADTIGLGRERAEKNARYRGAGAADQAKAEADYERFLRDIEEDEELRGNLNLFKAQEAGPAEDAMIEDSDVDDEEEDFPEIKVDDLLDEMDNLNIVSLCFAELWLARRRS